jgi:hypothetical protein
MRRVATVTPAGSLLSGQGANLPAADLALSSEVNLDYSGKL